MAGSLAHLAGVQLVSIDVSASMPVTGWAFLFILVRRRALVSEA